MGTLDCGLTGHHLSAADQNELRLKPISELTYATASRIAKMKTGSSHLHASPRPGGYRCCGGQSAIARAPQVIARTRDRRSAELEASATGRRCSCSCFKLKGRISNSIACMPLHHPGLSGRSVEQSARALTISKTRRSAELEASAMATGIGAAAAAAAAGASSLRDSTTSSRHVHRVRDQKGAHFVRLSGLIKMTHETRTCSCVNSDS